MQEDILHTQRLCESQISSALQALEQIKGDDDYTGWQ